MQGVLRAQMDDLKAESGVLTKKCQQTQQLLDKQRELSCESSVLFYSTSI